MCSNFKIRNYFFLSLFLLFHLNVINGLDIGINHASFQSQNIKYLEVALQVIGKSVNYIHAKDSSLNASVTFSLIIWKDSSIYSFDKFTLNSSNKNDITDFISLRRFKIENGNYILEVKAQDINDTLNVFNSKSKINVNLHDNICISDIQLLADVHRSSEVNPFVKNGFYMEQILSDFVPKNIDTLGIYCEIYNMDKTDIGKQIEISIFKQLNTNEPILTRKIINKNVSLLPVLTKLNINGLESGNYLAKVSIKDLTGNILVSGEKKFQRSTGFNEEMSIDSSTFELSFVNRISPDSLMYSLKALYPIIPPDKSLELNTLISEKKVKEGRFFLWSIWQASNNINAESAYRNYMKYADYVDKNFRSQVGYGFQTDRGYIFLKYGRPSEIITRESEPTAPPYEIWYYDNIKQQNQRNVKFIFYVPSLAHNDYELLHSTCIGEKNRQDWFYVLYSKRNDADLKNMKTGQINQFYENLKNSFDNNAVKIWEELK